MSVEKLREDEYSQQIIDIQREMERRREEREQEALQQGDVAKTYLNGPHLPPRLKTELAIRQEDYLPRPNAPNVSAPETLNVRWDDGIAASRKLGNVSPLFPMRLIDNSKIRDGPEYRRYRQKIIDRQKVTGQQAAQFKDERQPSAPYLPSTFNSSTDQTEQAIRQNEYLHRPSAPNVLPPETMNVRCNDGITASFNLVDSSPFMPTRLIDSRVHSSKIRDGPEYRRYRQKIIDRQKVTEQQAAQFKDECQSNAPYLPLTFNSSTDRPSYSGTGVATSVNSPHAPSATPDDGTANLCFPDSSTSKDDGLPSYEEAIAFDST